MNLDSSDSKIVNILNLPEELLVGVLAQLALNDLCQAAAACHKLRRVATDDRLLWRARCLDQFGPQAAKERGEGRSWKQYWDSLIKHHRRGVELFNQDGFKGLDYLFEHNVLRAEPRAVSDFLQSTPGLHKKSIGWLLGQRAKKDCTKEEETNLNDVDAPENVEDFYSQTAQLYMSEIDFRHKTVDEALRQLLLRIKLPGSAQFIRRILKDFASVYFRQNKDEAERLFRKPEGPYIAAYSILMLNTDLHNPRVSRKMKKNEFLEHFGGMVPGLPQEYVEGIYDRIKASELKVADDETADAAATAPAKNDEGEKKGRKGGFFSRFF